MLVRCVYVWYAFVLHIFKLISDRRGSFLTLSAAGYAGGSPVYNDQTLVLGRGPWRVIWESKAPRAGTTSRDCVLPRHPAQDQRNIQIHSFSFWFYCSMCITPPFKLSGLWLRFKLPSLWQSQTACTAVCTLPVVLGSRIIISRAV